MKLLTDFDGVWTEPRPEGAAVLDAIVEELARRADAPFPAASARVAHHAEAVRAAPDRHGWWVDGAITAYADEDPFTVANALVTSMAASDLEEDRAFADAIRDFDGPDRFGYHCHVRGVTRVLQQMGASLEDSVLVTLHRLCDACDEVIVASNSETTKLAAVFDQMGAGTPGEGRLANLRLAGGAGKFELAPEPPPPGGDPVRRFAGRDVRIDRGRYQTLLREIVPDAIVGDVFSLDLALPLALRASDPDFAGLEAFLIRRSYTPEWSLAATAEAGGRVVESLAELADVLETR